MKPEQVAMPGAYADARPVVDQALRQYTRRSNWRLRNCLMLICAGSVAGWYVVWWAIELVIPSL